MGQNSNLRQTIARAFKGARRQVRVAMSGLDGRLHESATGYDLLMLLLLVLILELL